MKFRLHVMVLTFDQEKSETSYAENSQISYLFRSNSHVIRRCSKFICGTHNVSLVSAYLFEIAWYFDLKCGEKQSLVYWNLTSNIRKTGNINVRSTEYNPASRGDKNNRS